MSSDDFAHLYSGMDKEGIESFLRSLTAPCYESTLLNIAFPDMSISGADALTLYRSHFLLFHFLHRLQDEFREQGEYLHIHFMRTFLLPYPRTGQCRFYEELAGRFCQTPCPSHPDYCEFHRNKLGDSELDMLSFRYFYLDERNFHSLNKETAEAFLNGTWEILRHYDVYENSFRVLGIPETSDMGLIRKRFRVLAHLHHPDKGEMSHEKFYEINNAYRLLMRMIPLFPTNTFAQNQALPRMS